MKLGIVPSRLKEALTNREYTDFYKFYIQYGFGERGHSIRSANEVMTIRSAAISFGSGKADNIDADDVYPQLSFNPSKKLNNRNRAVNWDKTRPALQRELIELGLYDKDGNPTRNKNGEM